MGIIRHIRRTLREKKAQRNLLKRRHKRDRRILPGMARRAGDHFRSHPTILMQAKAPDGKNEKMKEAFA